MDWGLFFRYTVTGLVGLLFGIAIGIRISGRVIGEVVKNLREEILAAERNQIGRRSGNA